MTDFLKDKDMQDDLLVVRKKKLIKRTVLIAVIVIVVSALITAIWFGGYNSAKNKANEEIEELNTIIEEMKQTPVVLDPITPEIVQNTISNELVDIQELVTEKYIFTNAAKFSDTKHIAVLPDSWSQKSFVQKWDGIIKAGVNLEKMEIKIQGNIITITLPYAEILSYEIDTKSVEILDEKDNVFNPIKIQDKVNFDRETSYSMKARAVENGLLEKAQKNAEITIRDILTASIKNINDYEIKFETIDK